MSTTIEHTDLAADWAAWHAEREATLTQPHGWLSLTGLHWLDATARAYPDLPGTWRATPDGAVEVTASATDDVVVHGLPVDGTTSVHPVDGGPGVLVGVGERQVEVLAREHHRALRVRDPQAPTRTTFEGVPAFPVTPAAVVEGRFTPDAAPRRIDVDTVVDGLGFHPTAVGTVRFGLDGEAQELTALDGGDGALRLHFRDGTSGEETYGGGRAVTTAAPDADGRVRIDLNRLVNLPCVFSGHATCPLPPAGNVVSVRVEAGELLPARSEPAP